MSKRTDTCIERWWQGVGVGEVIIIIIFVYKRSRPLKW